MEPPTPYKPEIILRYVRLLNLFAWLVVIGGFLWGAALFVLAFQAQGDPSPAALGAAVGVIVEALGAAFFLLVVAQLVRCFVRIEEHLAVLVNHAAAGAGSLALASPAARAPAAGGGEQHAPPSEPLPSTLPCPHCGKPVNRGATTCGSCWKKIAPAVG